MTKKATFWYEKYLFGALRKIWRWSPARREVIKRSAGTGLGYSRCKECANYVNQYHVDHRDPVVPLAGIKRLQNGSYDWNVYIERLLHREPEDLDVLCKSCHSKKTKSENAERRRIRKGAKE